MSHRPTCLKTDAVLAIYLDGDVEMDASGFEFACVEALTQHLRECHTCQRELQRARRLDAMLAENAGRMIASHANQGDRKPRELNPRGLNPRGQLDELATRWFVAVAEQATPTPQAPGSHNFAFAKPRRWVGEVLAPLLHPHAPLLAACLGGVALVIGTWWLGQSNGRQLAPTSERRVSEGGVSHAPPLAASKGSSVAELAHQGRRIAQSTLPKPSERLGAGLGAGLQADPQAGASPRPSAIVVANDAARRRPTTNLPQPVIDPVDQLRHLADVTLPTPLRIAAVKVLLLTLRPGSANGPMLLASLMQTMAAGQVGTNATDSSLAADRGAMAALHAEVRQDAWFVAQLRTSLQRLDHPKVTPNLDDLAVVTVAARLGLRELDTALLRAVRRHEQLVPALAAALRTNLRPQGAASLLLDAWGERAERGGQTDEETAAQVWFAGQPEAIFDEVRTELVAARSSPRRVRCLLALAHSPTAQCLDVLVAWTAAGCRAEAYAAAFALAQLPTRWLRPLVARAALEHDAFLLRAALARAGVREASPWLESLGLSARELDLLRDSGFAQFPTVADWFRDRGSLGD
jgi:hypothetical protein